MKNRTVKHSAPKQRDANLEARHAKNSGKAPHPEVGVGVPRFLQAQRTDNQPHDEHEAEANRVAQQVGYGYTVPLPAFRFAPTPVQTPLPANVNRVLARPGRSLDDATRQQMEARFGEDFADVRIHTGSEAAQSAKAMSAHAYTVGDDIVFNRDAHVPETAGGQQLLAHELTHVVQQRAGHRRIQRNAIETTYVEPRSVYLIRESVHRVPGIPSIPHTGGQLGPFLLKVQRTVLQLHAVWEPASEPGLVDALLDWTGITPIEREYTGDHRWVQVYSGFRNILQVRGGIEVAEIPNLGLFELGDDPIPHIQLYGSRDIDFISEGGTGAPTASALYDGSNNRMQVMTEENAEALVGAATELPGASLQPGPVISEETE